MTVYDRFRISFDRNSNPKLLEQISHSLTTLANKKGYVAPAIVQRDA